MDHNLPLFETASENEARAQVQRLLVWWPRFAARVNELRSEGYDWKAVERYGRKLLVPTCMMAVALCLMATAAHADVTVSYWLAHKDQLRIANHWCLDHDPLARQQRCATAFVAWHQWEVDAVMASARKHFR